MPRQRVRHDPGGAGHSEVHCALGPVRVVRVIGQKHGPVSQQSEGCGEPHAAFLTESHTRDPGWSPVQEIWDGEAQPRQQMQQLDEPEHEPVDILPMTGSIYRQTLNMRANVPS
jgi:hypothetical protein